jgi:hypothetical protein
MTQLHKEYSVIFRKYPTVTRITINCSYFSLTSSGNINDADDLPDFYKRNATSSNNKSPPPDTKSLKSHEISAQVDISGLPNDFKHLDSSQKTPTNTIEDPSANPRRLSTSSSSNTRREVEGRSDNNYPHASVATGNAE